MAIERILKCTSCVPFFLLNESAVKTWADLFNVDKEAWNKFSVEDQDEALRYLIARSFFSTHLILIC